MKYKKTVIASLITSASVGALVGVWAFADHILKTKYPAENIASDSMVQNDLEAFSNKNHKENKEQQLKHQIKNLKRKYKDSIDVNETLVKSLSQKDNILNNKDQYIHRLQNKK